VSLDEQLPPFPGQPGQPDQPGYPVAPPQPQRTSGLAITGFVFSFVFSPLGFLLSLIAVFKTGAGKAKGRGLAIAGLIISALLITCGIVLVVRINNSTLVDPGCTAGEAAIVDNSKTVNAESVRKTLAGLNAATAEAKNADVRNATKALAGDYTQLQTGMTTHKMPAGLQDKLTADATKLDSLCTIGN
jgi:hypothetical protein